MIWWPHNADILKCESIRRSLKLKWHHGLSAVSPSRVRTKQRWETVVLQRFPQIIHWLTQIHIRSSPVGLWSSFCQANKGLSVLPVVHKGTITTGVQVKTAVTLKITQTPCKLLHLQIHTDNRLTDQSVGQFVALWMRKWTKALPSHDRVRVRHYCSLCGCDGLILQEQYDGKY